MINNEASSIMSFGSADAFRQQQQEALDPSARFREPRQPGDFDFVAEVRGIMALNNFPMEAVQAFESAKIVQDASIMRPDAQRHLLNRFFRTQMLSLREVDSIDVRTCLVEGGEYHDWIRLFKDSVVPFLIQNSLPKILF